MSARLLTVYACVLLRHFYTDEMTGVDWKQFWHIVTWSAQFWIQYWLRPATGFLNAEWRHTVNACCFAFSGYISSILLASTNFLLIIKMFRPCYLSGRKASIICYRLTSLLVFSLRVTPARQNKNYQKNERTCKKRKIGWFFFRENFVFI